MADTDTQKGDVEVAIAELGGKFVSDRFGLPDGGDVVFVGRDLRAERLEPLNPVLPDFVTQTETMVEAASFKDYLQQFKSPNAICRASLGARQIVAVLDYHGRAREGADAAVPGRGKHVVTLTCPYDADYAKWRAVFGQGLPQEAMIAFLEDMIHTIAEPAAADLIEAFSDIQIERMVKFRSKRNEKNGNITALYAEQDGDDTREGSFTVPDQIVLIVPIFQGGNPVQLTAKVRLRMEKGALVLGFVVPGLENLERETFRNIGEDVRKATSTPVFYTA